MLKFVDERKVIFMQMRSSCIPKYLINFSILSKFYVTFFNNSTVKFNLLWIWSHIER